MKQAWRLLHGAERARFPAGPLADKWERHQFDLKLVNPANKRKFTVIVVGSGLGGCLGGREHERAGLQREVLLLPGLAPAGALDRGAGRHQRRQELPERRRQRLAAVLRHDQGRRLPRARGQRLPPGRDQRAHHRPVRGAGSAVRAGVRRFPGQPLVRRGAGVAHLLRARPDGPAAAARRLPGAGEGSAAGRRADELAQRDARHRDGGRPRAGHRDARPGDRRRSSRTSPTRWCSPPAATATCSISPPTRAAATSPPRGGRTGAAPLFANPVLHPDPPDLHPGERRLPVEAHADVGVAAQRRPGMGAGEGG